MGEYWRLQAIYVGGARSLMMICEGAGEFGDAAT
jgi:hypothetical protein